MDVNSGRMIAVCAYKAYCQCKTRHVSSCMIIELLIQWVLSASNKPTICLSTARALESDKIILAITNYTVLVVQTNTCNSRNYISIDCLIRGLPTGCPNSRGAVRRPRAKFVTLFVHTTTASSHHHTATPSHHNTSTKIITPSHQTIEMWRRFCGETRVKDSKHRLI
jgi:hypothetical protein